MYMDDGNIYITVDIETTVDTFSFRFNSLSHIYIVDIIHIHTVDIIHYKKIYINMSHFTFSDSMASMPQPASNNNNNNNNNNNSNYNNMDNAKLMERLQAAEQRAETFRLGKLQLVHDLEQGFSKVCEFMQEQYNKSPDDEVTARWFKHIISDLRTSCESEAQQNKIEPMREEDSNVMQKFTESDANFIDNMDFSFSGINSFSPRGVGYGTSFQTTYGNSMAAFPHASKPAPKTMVRQQKAKSKGFVESRGRPRNATKSNKPKKKKDGKEHVYFCAICNKSFAGASGLWYHNKHVHNAITQSRPRGKSKKTKNNNNTVKNNNNNNPNLCLTLDANNNVIAGY